jgi:hypothetical protein
VQAYRRFSCTSLAAASSMWQVHRIISAAWKRMGEGIVSPSTLAVVRLMLSAHVIGYSTGSQPAGRL